MEETITERAKTYEERRAHFEGLSKQYSKKYITYSTARVILFLVFAGLLIYFANARNGAAVAGLAIGFPLVFGVLVNRHNKIAATRDRYKHIATINNNELKRINHELADFDEGMQFEDDTHPFASDLDLFGRNSLYQLLNRTNSPTGAQTLASWLREVPGNDTVVERQSGVQELQSSLEWRQNFQAAGMGNLDEQQHFADVVAWINAPNKVIHQKTTKVLAYVLPVVTLFLLGLVVFANLSIYFFIGMLVINGLIIKRYAAYTEAITESTGKGISTLKAYGELIKIIEKASFKSLFLVDLQKVFIHNGTTASSSILKLQGILQYLQARANAFYLIFNLVLLFDIHLLLKAEKWKRTQKQDVTLWFNNIGTFETINSLAGFAYSNPDFSTPQIDTGECTLRAENIGHPLIPRSVRINNDFGFKENEKVGLITGSNMSGKSTFLRTLGVNIVLAYAGAPVCAHSMRLSIMQLFTGMRTKDNLEEHISSFYAELQRIKQLLFIVEKGQPVIYMLDEILKGTNSHDRNAGAEALIRQLLQTNSIGFVSTHDLELGKIAESSDQVVNYSFNSTIKGEKIIFNYKLEDGLCRSFNASKLMEQIGIKMDSSNTRTV